MINKSKTKCLIFHKGRLPKNETLYLDGETIARVNSFTYLGVLFTNQLSFSKHIDLVCSKARARIGFLFLKLPICYLPLPVALAIFRVYVQPLFTYCLSVWYPRSTNTSRSQIDSVLTCYLKRYLGVPKWVNNSSTHFLCNTVPFRDTLENLITSSCLSSVFPSVLSGYKPSCFNFVSSNSPYSPIPFIPSTFWLNENFCLPSDPSVRQAKLSRIMDIDHMNKCSSNVFHPHFLPDCVCQNCDNPCLFRHTC